MREMSLRVARALVMEYLRQRDDDPFKATLTTDWEPSENDIMMADAAIAAMREPTEAMLQAAAMDDIPDPTGRLAWVDMIDAALK
jgi:hypothetical protein